MNNIIPNGKHMLSGVGLTTLHDEWDDSIVEGIVLEIDNKSYVTYTDPDDGYRSYGTFYETTELPQTTFPPQPVIAENVHVEEQDDDGWPTVYDMLILYNEQKDVILKVGTDHSDTYYPFAIFQWHPENLSVNITTAKKLDKDECQ